MATIFVWDGGTNTAPYDTWTKAATTLVTAWDAWTSGDVVYMQWDHQESQATEILLNSDVMSDIDPFILYSVDKDASDVLKLATAYNFRVTGANVDIDINDACVFVGAWFEFVDGDLDLSTANPGAFIQCNFKWTTNTAQRAIALPGTGVTFVDCTFNNATASAAGGVIFSGGSAIFWVRGGSWTGHAGAAGLVQNGLNASPNTRSRFEGFDMSAMTNTSLLFGTSTCVDIVNCKLAGGDLGQIQSGGYQHRSQVISSGVDGAGSAKGYINESWQCPGSIAPVTDVYRTAGFIAADGSTPLSRKISTSSTYMRGEHTPVISQPLSAYVSSTGSKTFTVYAVHDYTAAPTIGETWIELLYLGTANSVLASFATTRTPLSTTSLTTSTEGWTLSGQSKVELAKTVTINKTGLYAVRLYHAKHEAAKALWYCPLVDVA